MLQLLSIDNQQGPTVHAAHCRRILQKYSLAFQIHLNESF